MTQFVIKENTKKDPVVSSLRWYLIYLLDNDTVKTTLIEHTLERHVVEMQKNPLNVKSFWYFAASGDSFTVSPEAAQFLDDHFVVAKNLILYDSGTIYYEVKDKNAANNKNATATSISLSEISDDNWIGGVGITYNMFLATYSPETDNILKNALRMKFKDGRTAIITGYEKVGPYIHLHIQGNVNAYTEVAKFPNRITFISKKEQP